MLKSIFSLVIFAAIAAPLGAAEWGAFDSGFTQAAKNKKPVIVDFSTDWCSWCKKMDKEVFSRGDIKNRLAKEFNTVRIDAESNTALTYKGKKMTAREFTTYMRIQGFPTLIVFDPAGEPLTMLPGFVEGNVFNMFLDYINKACYKKNTFEQYYKSGGTCK
jgi:thioredoxin-related protein